MSEGTQYRFRVTQSDDVALSLRARSSNFNSAQFRPYDSCGVLRKSGSPRIAKVVPVQCDGRADFQFLCLWSRRDRKRLRRSSAPAFLTTTCL